MAHFLDFIAFLGLCAAIYECIVSSSLLIIHYLITSIRFSYSYFIIFFIIYIFAKSLFTGYGYNYKPKYLNKLKKYNIPQLNYFIFFLQEYNYFILLVLNLICFIFIFYYGLYYNIFIIGIFLLLYVFLGLHIGLKYWIKKYEPRLLLYANENMLHFYLNIVLCIVMLVYISLISETIIKEIDFKIDLTEYLLGALLRKDRFFLKLKDDYNLTRLWALYQNEKFSMNYLFLKNKILNNSILNEASYPKLKYSNFNENETSDFYTLINKQNIDNIQIEKSNLETLNLNNNNIYFENEVVWYERNFQNKNLEQFNELTKMEIFKYKNNITWYTYLLNVYKLNWFNFMPSGKEIQNVTALLKSEKYKNYEYINEILLLKDDVKLLNENMLDNYNEYTLLKKKIVNIYKFDFYTLLKYKYVYNKDIFNFINELFLITNTNKNNINLQIQIYNILNFRYQDISNLINELLNFKNNLNIILYNYTYILNWWEKNCYIIHSRYNEVAKQQYASLKKYLVTEKNLLALDIIEPGESDVEEMIEELNTDQWMEGLLSPLDLLKKSTTIKSIERNILYFNVYKDLLSLNLKELDFRENAAYYYDYLFREFGLFKINHIMYSIVTFERPDSWFDYYFKEYLPFLKNIGVYEKINSFWKFHKPTNKYFYYFFNYRNKLSLATNNILYRVSKSNYFETINVTTTFESKLLDFNKGKWSLYFDLMEFRYNQFIEACCYIYACDLNFMSNDAAAFLESKMNKNINADINKNINENISVVNVNSNGINGVRFWVELFKFWFNLNGLEKVDAIKNYILVVAENAYPENPKFKKYLLANAEYLAIHWAGKFGKGASLVEFINMLKNLNLSLLNEKNPYVEYLKTHKFQDLNNKFLNRSDYWDIYTYYSQFSSVEERIVYEKMSRWNSFKVVAELAYNTSWCMTLDPVEYENNFESLIYNTFYEENYEDLLNAYRYYNVIDNKDAFLKDFLPEMLLDQRVFRRALFDFYFDDEANPFDIFKKPEPKNPRMNFHPLPLIHTSSFANAMGYEMLDTLNTVEELFNEFYIPSVPLVSVVFKDIGTNGLDIEDLTELITNEVLAETANQVGLIPDKEYGYLKQSLVEANKGIYDSWYIRQQIVDRVEFYNMLFKFDALRYLEMQYINDLEFFEDIINEIEVEYNKIIVDAKREVENRLESLLEWKINKDIYKAECKLEMLKKENNDLKAKYGLNKNWEKYNYQRYREEFPAPFKNKLDFFRNKK